MFEGDIETAGGAMEIAPVYLMRPKEVMRHGKDMTSMQARIDWERYNTAAVLHRQLVEPHAGTDAELRVLDPFVQCAARVSVMFAISQRSGPISSPTGPKSPSRGCCRIAASRLGFKVSLRKNS